MSYDTTKIGLILFFVCRVICKKTVSVSFFFCCQLCRLKVTTRWPETVRCGQTLNVLNIRITFVFMKTPMFPSKIDKKSPKICSDL
jgi:hypothetical protein